MRRWKIYALRINENRPTKWFSGVLLKLEVSYRLITRRETARTTWVRCDGSRGVCDSQSHPRNCLFLPCFIICTPQAAIAQTAANSSVIERKEETCSKSKRIEEEEKKEIKRETTKAKKELKLRCTLLTTLTRLWLPKQLNTPQQKDQFSPLQGQNAK